MNQAVKTSICSALIVDREAFLWECFAQQVPDPIREQLRTCAPAAAGVDEQQIEQVSRALIHAHADVYKRQTAHWSTILRNERFPWRKAISWRI